MPASVYETVPDRVGFQHPVKGLMHPLGNERKTKTYDVSLNGGIVKANRPADEK